VLVIWRASPPSPPSRRRHRPSFGPVVGFSRDPDRHVTDSAAVKLPYRVQHSILLRELDDAGPPAILDLDIREQHLASLSAKILKIKQEREAEDGANHFQNISRLTRNSQLCSS
jgi:hypothetical protein